MAGVQKKIVVCLVTPGHISSDPRLVKEAAALAAHGFGVHIIFTQYMDYLIDYDQELLSGNPDWKVDCLNYYSQGTLFKIKYLFSRFLRLISKNRQINRSFAWQLKKAIAVKADLYIAHNLGALPVAALAAKRNQAKCGFDAEDFHRNEITNDTGDPGVKLRTYIENAYLKQVDYVTASSPLIGKGYNNLFPYQDPVIILNVFSTVTGLPIRQINDRGPVKLFWFSQTVGTNRGLQDVLDALEMLREYSFELHILGNCAPLVKITLQRDNLKNIYFHDPLPPTELIGFAADFDIGLALEPGFSINNDFALSNKIFTYLQAGLVVVASDTTAQRAFLEQYPAAGKYYVKANAESLAALLRGYDSDRQMLLAGQKAASELAVTLLNWETEQHKFIAVVSKVLEND